MSITIKELVLLPELKTRFLNKENNFNQVVHWAHVSELPDPTEWLGEGDLLMTTGIGIPAKQKDQELYIQKLALAGLSGIMIGENMKAPHNLSALIKKADELGFPVLMTEYGVPFSTVVRVIIDANNQDEFFRRNVINRLCVSARKAIEGMDLESLLTCLEQDVDAQLMILDPQNLQQCILPKGLPIPEKLQKLLSQQTLALTSSTPLVQKYSLDDGDVFAIVVPSRRKVILLLKDYHGHLFEYSVLHYLVAVLGIAIERLYVETERTLRIGAQLLNDMLNLRLSNYEIDKQLIEFGLSLDSSCIAITRPTEIKLREWGVQLSRLKLRCLLLSQAEDVIILLNQKDLPLIQSVLKCSIGYSAFIKEAERIPEALREARLAFSHATHEINSAISYTAIAGRMPWLPSTVEQAAQNFQQILGALIIYQEKHDTPLLHSLHIFLDCNRSWQAAAKQLHIHKTTLIYRIKKIESLTGRSLDRTEDVAILWLGLQSGIMAGLYTR